MCSVTQSCPTLYSSINYRPPGSSVCGIFQARILERLPLPTPEDLPYAGIKPPSLASAALAGGFITTITTWETLSKMIIHIIYVIY